MSLIDYLRSGRLGFLALDIPGEQILKTLHSPDERTPPSRKLELWKYGNLQVALTDHRVSFIGIYFDGDELKLPEAFEIKDWPSGKTQKGEFVRKLVSEGVKFEIYPMLTFDNQVCLRLQSGIHVYFMDGLLRSIQLGKQDVS